MLLFFVGIQLKLCLLICKACATPSLHEHLITLHEIQIICETFSNVFCMCNNFPPHFWNVTLKLSNIVHRLGSNILCVWLIDARFASLNCFQGFVCPNHRGSSAQADRTVCFTMYFCTTCYVQSAPHLKFAGLHFFLHYLVICLVWRHWRSGDDHRRENNIFLVTSGTHYRHVFTTQSTGAQHIYLRILFLLTATICRCFLGYFFFLQQGLTLTYFSMKYIYTLLYMVTKKTFFIHKLLQDNHWVCIKWKKFLLNISAMIYGAAILKMSQNCLHLKFPAYLSNPGKCSSFYLKDHVIHFIFCFT